MVPKHKQKFEMRLQAAQNKCIGFYLKVNDRSSFWSYPNCFDDIYVPLEINGVHTCSSYQKLNVPCRKTNVGQKTVSYAGPSHWNNLN